MALVRTAVAEPGRVQTAAQLVALGIVVMIAASIVAGSPGADARAYWSADASQPYRALYETPGAYLYSPAFLQTLAPLRLLPFEAFFAIWIALNGAVLLWLAGPIVAALLLLPASWSPVWVDLWFGNITILMAASVVIGFRYPAAWTFLLLTKVTPGVGLLWFVVRREWRRLGLALGATALIVALSFAIGPHLWPQWLDSLQANAARPEANGLEGSSLGLRLAAAALLVGLGAWFGAWWVLPVALFVAQPAVWFIGFNLFLVWIALARRPAFRPMGARDA